MPDIDLTDVLLDSTWVSQLTVVRRQSTVGNNGVAVVRSSTLRPYGFVVIDSNRLDTAPEMRTSPKRIVVVTTFRLRNASVDAANINYFPDVVNWEGNSYQVDELLPFSEYGPGFVEARCASIDWVDAPPP